MQFVLDMVHHNPGEAPFPTQFLDPKVLDQFGYNGQVFKHINCALSFDALGTDVFPQGSEDRAWLDETAKRIRSEVDAAVAAGRFITTSIFCLAQALVEQEGDAIGRQWSH